jgi:hypothetical protein
MATIAKTAKEVQRFFKRVQGEPGEEPGEHDSQDGDVGLQPPCDQRPPYALPQGCPAEEPQAWDPPRDRPAEEPPFYGYLDERRHSSQSLQRW